MWSPQQERALKEVGNWLRDPNRAQVFRLFGYAGTGKTTLAKEIPALVEGKVLFAAFTGKAALVLRQKGCAQASTIHSLIYHSKERGRARLRELERNLLDLRVALKTQNVEDIDGHAEVKKLSLLITEERNSLAQPFFVLNPESEVRDAALVVVDEISMVDSGVGQDLLGFGTPILVLGDPAQLPPVYGGGFFTEQKPDVMLTEVHRQALESPVLALATSVREGKTLLPGRYGESRVLDKPSKEVMAQHILECQQLLAGRNVTRQGANARLRQLKGFHEPLPMPGDRLVCLRNNHNLALLNGSIWNVEKTSPEWEQRIDLEIASEEDPSNRLKVECHSQHFLGVGKDIPFYEKKEAEEFDYGNCLTVHKSQGSSWESVAVIDESNAFREHRHRWLYTALTRAEKKVNVFV